MIQISQSEIMKNWGEAEGGRPLVSIKCLTFNQEKFLEKALDGFLMQKTSFPFEVVVHDDASSDGTVSIIKEYERKYPQIIKPIYETENQYSKGKGILRAIVDSKLTGKYIAFCEGDDFWIDENKLQNQIDYMESNEDCGLCYTDCNFVDEDGNITQVDVFKSKVNPIPNNFREHLFNLGYIAPMSWVMRKTVYDSLDLSAITTDGTFVMALEFFLKSKVYFMDCTTSCYRQHANSVSQQTDPMRRYKYLKGVYESGLYYCNKYLDKDSIVEFKVSMYRALIQKALELKDKEFAFEYLCDSDISRNPAYHVNMYKSVYHLKDGSSKTEIFSVFPSELKLPENAFRVEVGFPQFPCFFKVSGIKNEAGESLDYAATAVCLSKDLVMCDMINSLSIDVDENTRVLSIMAETYPVSIDMFLQIARNKSPEKKQSLLKRLLSRK